MPHKRAIREGVWNTDPYIDETYIVLETKVHAPAGDLILGVADRVVINNPMALLG